MADSYLNSEVAETGVVPIGNASWSSDVFSFINVSINRLAFFRSSLTICCYSPVVRNSATPADAILLKPDMLLATWHHFEGEQLGSVRIWV